MKQEQTLHNEKEKKIMDLLLNKIPQDENVIIFYDENVDKENLEKLLRGFDIPYRIINGENTEVPETVKKWNSGEYKVLLGQPKACGAGLNLQERGSTIIIHSQGYDQEKIIQRIRRVYRTRQTKDCQVYRIMVLNTEDENIWDDFKQKKEIQENLLNAINRIEIIEEKEKKEPKYKKLDNRSIVRMTPIGKPVPKKKVQSNRIEEKEKTTEEKAKITKLNATYEEISKKINKIFENEPKAEFIMDCLEPND